MPIMFFIARFLKLLGKTNEAEELFLSVENMLVQSWSMTGMLPKVQNAIGELYLEIGMTEEGRLLYFQKAWSNLMEFSSSNLKDNQDLVKQKGRVLNNLAKSASKEYLKENHILQCATEMSSLLYSNTCDQATMKYAEGVLISAAGNASLAKMKFQDCLNIRKFGEKNTLVGEIMEFLADLLFFPLRHSERRKQAIEYYKQVIKIKENAGTLANSSLVRKQLIYLPSLGIQVEEWAQLCDFKNAMLGFPGGTVVQNLPANAGDTGLSPGLGRSRMPSSN
ncbi:LOW QUALITY PROTEIN: putative tetratricopeptide repeat protein 41 [Megaptera novaeangliae]